MIRRDKDHEAVLHRASLDLTADARQRERKMQVLRRIAEALDRPIEDFFEGGSEENVVKRAVDIE